jgi:hypothetical protein
MPAGAARDPGADDARLRAHPHHEPFAALDMATSSVIARHCRRHRHREFLRFLKLIDDAVPGGLNLHLLCGSYATHKTPAIHERLLR